MKLNLGCGDWKLDSWENVDLPQVDLSVFPWPWADESVDEILASHILEHFNRLQGVRFLDECRRVLAPGGMLHIATPDMDRFIDCRLDGDFSPLEGYKWTDLNYLLGGDETEILAEQRHKYMYCWASLYYPLHFKFTKLILRDGLEHFDNPKYAAISLYVDVLK